MTSNPDVKFPVLDGNQKSRTRNQTIRHQGNVIAQTDTMADIVKHYVTTANVSNQHKQNKKRHTGIIDDRSVQIRNNSQIPSVSLLDTKFLKT